MMKMDGPYRPGLSFYGLAVASFSFSLFAKVKVALGRYSGRDQSLPSFAGILPGLTVGFHVSTAFYRILLVFTGFYWFLLVFTGFYWDLLGFELLIPGLGLLKVGFTWFYPVILGYYLV